MRGVGAHWRCEVCRSEVQGSRGARGEPTLGKERARWRWEEVQATGLGHELSCMHGSGGHALGRPG